MEKCDLLQVINDVCSELSTKLQKSSDTVNNTIKNPKILNGNYTLLHAIFRNLIENAINYAGEKITINIELYMEDEHYYYLSVWDNGKGVQEDAIPKLFDRFYRPGEGRTRADGGSGLGLSIVKNSVLFHNGSVSAKNKLNAGLEILFSLHK